MVILGITPMHVKKIIMNLSLLLMQIRLKPNVSVSNGVYCWYDGDEKFEKMVERTWAPYPIASRYDEGPQFGFEKIEDLAYVGLADVERVGEVQHVVSMNSFI
jgi:hypothetical protein